MVAAASGIPTERIEVTAEGELDLRGTLGIDREVAVGFDRIVLRFDVEGAGDRRDELIEKTLRYCVVLQTLQAAAADRDHVATSRITNAAKTTLMTPFIVKNAASSRRRSPGRTSACSYPSSTATTATPSQ